MENENRLSDAPLDNSGWDELTDVDYSGDAIETFQVPDTDIPPGAEFSEPPIGDSSTDVLKPILDVEESSNQPEEDHSETMVDLPDKRREIHAVDFEKYMDDEKKLKDNLIEAFSKRADKIQMAGIEIPALFVGKNHELSKAMIEDFGVLHQKYKVNSEKSLKAFFKYIDAVYPAPFEQSKEHDPIDQLKNEYKSSVSYNDTYDSIKKIGKDLRLDPSTNDMTIAKKIDNIADASGDKGVQNALFNYIEDPTEENLKILRNNLGEHADGVCNNLLGIAGTLNDSNTSLGKSLAEPVVIIKDGFKRGYEDEANSMIDYIKFKIDGGGLRGAIMPSSKQDDANASGPLSEPAIF